MRKRISLELRSDALLHYKHLRKIVRIKIKSDIRNYESNIVENSKIHPKLLYKYIKDKTNIRESVRALHGDDGSINPILKTSAINSMFGFIPSSI